MFRCKVGSHYLALGNVNALHRSFRKSLEVVCGHTLRQHVYESTRRPAEHGSNLDLVFSPGAIDVSYTDIPTAQGIGDHAVLLVSWRYSTRIPVRSRSDQNVCRGPFEGMSVVPTNIRR